MGLLSDIRAGLIDALDNVYGGNAWSVNAYIRSQPSPPAIEVFPSRITYHEAMSNETGLEFTVRALIPFASDQGAQTSLDLLLDPDGSLSLRAAIEDGDTTLGGVVDDIKVIEATVMDGLLSLADGATYLVCEWTVQILT